MADKWEKEHRKELKRQYKEEQRTQAAAERVYYESLAPFPAALPTDASRWGSSPSGITPGLLAGLSLAGLVLSGLVGGLIGAVQYGVEHWLGWSSGTSFLMRASGATLLGEMAGAMLIALVINGMEIPNENDPERFTSPYLGAILGGLLGAPLGCLAGWFGWTAAIVDPTRGFHLPTLLERLFSAHWPGFWERVAGSAASLIVVVGLAFVVGAQAAAAFGSGNSRSSRCGRTLLIFAPVAWAVFWVVANS